MQPEVPLFAFVLEGWNLTPCLANMADKCHSAAKRFKPCKIRVKTQTTSGKKICRSITVKSTSHKLSEEVEAHPSSSFEGEIPNLNYDDINHVVDNESERIEPVQDGGLSAYHRKRVKEYSSWKSIRQSLVEARVEEEVISSLTCVTCGSPSVCRCLDCGPRQFFCLVCVKLLHHDRNYFHIPEIYEVCKCVYISCRKLD